jgi:hypothetical protein
MRNMEIKAEDLILWKNDPFLYLLREKLGLSDLQITLYLTVIAAIAILGLGWIADSFYTGTGIRFTEPQFLYFTLITTFFLAPVVIGAYVWQCSGFINVLQNFEQTNVIEKESAKESGYVESYSDFLIKFQKAIDRKIWPIIAVISTIVLLILEFLVILPLQFNFAGRSAFWYDVKWFLMAINYSTQ